MHQYRFRERLDHGDNGRPWHLYTLTAVQGHVFPCHWHPEWELLVVERGTMVLTRNQTVQILGSGEAAFLTAADLHTGTSDDPELLVHALVFRSELVRSERRDAVTDQWIVPLEAGALMVPAVLSAASDPARVARKLVEAIVQEGPGVELTVKGLVFQFLAAVVAAKLFVGGEPLAARDPVLQIRGILPWIEEHFANALTVEDLAARVGLSSSQFSRLFKAVTGDSPIHHLIRRRTAEAERLLRDGQLSVTDAALRVGFTNFSHFTRTFRAHQGMNPSEVPRRSPPRDPV